MSAPLLLLQFLLKHFLVAHVLDIGFSDSKMLGNRFWFSSYLRWMVMEATLLTVILRNMPVLDIAAAVFLESAMHLILTAIERHALPGYELRMHFYCGIGLFLFYTALTVLLIR